MATVYRANQTELDRVVALKVLKTSQFQTPEQQMRFRQEAQLINSLSHPNIVSIYSTGISENGTAYIAMELLEGKALADLVKTEGPLNYRDALPLFIQTCSALEHAHSKGIIHRDIKPSNLVVVGSPDAPRQVKVVDFGIAKVLEGDSLTRTNVIMGSVFYLSPGQCEGRSADTQSDIYALGCSLFETLAGRPPFVADFYLQTLAQHRESDPPRIKDVRPDCDLPASLEAVIDCCLQKSKDRRYKTIEELRTDLQHVLENRQPQNIPQSSTPATKQSQGAPRVSRQVIIFGITMLAAAALIFCGSRYFEQSQDFVDLEGERNEIRRLILLCHKPGEPVGLEESEKLLTEALERAIRIDDPVLQTKASTELLCSLDSDGSSSIPITELQKKLQRFTAYSEAATTKLQNYLKKPGKIKQEMEANDVLVPALIIQSKIYGHDSAKLKKLYPQIIEAYYHGTKDGMYRDMALSALGGLIKVHITDRENKQVMARTRERIALMRTDRHTTTADVNRMLDDLIYYARACFNNEATDQLQALRQ